MCEVSDIVTGKTVGQCPVIELKGLQFSWTENFPVLSIEGFTVKRGEHLFIMGPSGSGKTTLLVILAGILTPQYGDARVLAQSMTSMSSGERDRFRAHHIGYIFQMFNLVPYLSVVENVVLPCRFSAERRRKITESGCDVESEALRLLAHLNMANPQLLEKPVVELSTGQQQRVAAARALIGAPEIIIADEPTSALDADHREAFLKLLFKECREAGTTLVFVSHDSALASLFDTSMSLRDINGVGESESGEEGTL